MRYFLFALLWLPSISLAAETQAGFPTQAIWVSKSAAVAGETLVVSVVVYNGNTSMLKGTLVFTDDDARIGVRELELPAGESIALELSKKSRRIYDQLVIDRELPERQPATHRIGDEILVELLRVPKARIAILQHHPRDAEPMGHVVNRELPREEHLRVLWRHLRLDPL